MQGRRVLFRPGFPGDFAEPGDYCKIPPGMDPRADAAWYLLDPSGRPGAVLTSKHTITEHEDGTISCSPSLVMPGGWHGFLQAGVWSEC